MDFYVDVDTRLRSSAVSPSTITSLRLMGWQGDKTHVYHDQLSIDSERLAQIEASHGSLTGRIIECSLDAGGSWQFVKTRDDKMRANHVGTIARILASIRDSSIVESLIENNTLMPVYTTDRHIAATATQLEALDSSAACGMIERTFAQPPDRQSGRPKTRLYGSDSSLVRKLCKFLP